MSAQSGHRETVTLRQLPRRNQAGEPGKSYLLVVAANVSYVYNLPDSGEIVIGRAEKANIRLDDPAASRQHAQIVVTSQEIHIIDLESHNGTRVNKELVTGPRSLLSGDVILIGDAKLVLHREQAVPSSPAIQDWLQLRRRLEEELERARSYQRPLAVAVFELGDDLLDRSQLDAALVKELRLIDFPGWGSSGQLLLIMPELTQVELLHAIDDLVAVLQPLAPQLRAGYAQYPSDGSDGDTLIRCAHGAARAAAPSQVGAAIDQTTTRTVGDTEVIIGDPAMQSVYELVERLAASDIPVLICGETGTGKELVALALHYWSRRKGRRLVNINSAALQDTLAESQLFGHLKGAFTGATSDRIGLLEEAQGGTVFIDELGEMSPSIQAKLLRALDTRHIQPLGSASERPINVRIVAATNRDLETEIAGGRFRADLYYRVNAGTIALPPLRTRQRELPTLARSFLQLECKRLGRPQLTISNPALAVLLSCPWPGNIRQLKNEMAFLAAAVDGPTIEVRHLREQIRATRLPSLQTPIPGTPLPPELPLRNAKAGYNLVDELKEMERKCISLEMQRANGDVKRAAAALHMPLRTLYHKLKQRGLDADDAREGDTREGR